MNTCDRRSREARALFRELNLVICGQVDQEFPERDLVVQARARRRDDIMRRLGDLWESCQSGTNPGLFQEVACSVRAFFGGPACEISPAALARDWKNRERAEDTQLSAQTGQIDGAGGV